MSLKALVPLYRDFCGFRGTRSNEAPADCTQKKGRRQKEGEQRLIPTSLGILPLGIDATQQ